MKPKRLRSNTCLAMLRDEEGKLWFAGDRRMSWDMSQAQKSPSPKIAHRDGNLYAGTGVSSVCNEVVDNFNIDAMSADSDPTTYMTRVWLPTLLATLHQDGLLARDEQGNPLRRLAYKERRSEIPGVEDEWFGAFIIVGIQSDLFELQLDNVHIAFDRIDAPYATGCGGHFAWGSLLTTEKLGMEPRVRLRLALQAAAKVSPGCDASIDVLHN